MKTATFMSLLLFLSISIAAQARNPVILIPGLAGSELREKNSNERVWFTPLRTKSEDLRLPIEANPTKPHDNLVATDVLRSIKIAGFSLANIYGDFIDTMTRRDGYHEEKWDAPSGNGDHDALYVFPYDWRLDNVANARLLVRRIEELRARLGKPNLKFDVVAHSMGGLIVRYAAMYGDSDLPAEGARPQPKWSGAKLFDKVILMGTPNDGSALALDMLVNGVNLKGFRVDLPFLPDTSKFAAFTIPSGYQLLPAPGTFRVYNDRLRPIDVDLYDPRTWSKYGWNVIDDSDFVTQFSSSERLAAREYLRAALVRAKRFHEALAADSWSNRKIHFYLVGSSCYESLDAVVVYQDASSGRWHTLFRPRHFTDSSGRVVSAAAVKKVLFRKGDGIVTQRSLEGFGTSAVPETLVCGEHTTLAANTKIQNSVIRLLGGSDTRTTAATAPR